MFLKFSSEFKLGICFALTWVAYLALHCQTPRPKEASRCQKREHQARKNQDNETYVNPKAIVQAAMSTGDPQVISQIAKDYFMSRHDVPSEINNGWVYTRDHIAIAFNLLLANGDSIEFRKMMTALAEDPLVEVQSFQNPFYTLGPRISKGTAEALRPVGLAAIQKSQISQWRQEYIKFFERLAQSLKETGTAVIVKSEGPSKVERRDPFQSEKERVSEALRYGQNYSLERARDFVRQGDNFLAHGDHWDAFFRFTAARDIDGLRRTYRAIISQVDAPKRYLSYVTVAIAMIEAENKNLP